MTEQYPSDVALNALSGSADAEQGVAYPAIYESPYYTTFYKMLYRLLDVARRAGDLRVAKDGPLTCEVKPGQFFDRETLRPYAGVTEQPLTNNATNYLYLDADATLTINTTGFPAPNALPHIRLATILTADGDYAHGEITDCRGSALTTLADGGAGVCRVVSQSLMYYDFTDNGDVTGYADFEADLPAGALLMGYRIDVTDAFEGDVFATATLGDASDLDRFSGSDILAVDSVGPLAGQGASANRFCESATTPRVTVTVANDFGNSSGGEMAVTLFYLQT